VKKNHRSKSYGHDLIAFTLSTIGNHEEIKISAQQHLSEFYQKHGFTPVGASYSEDGIPHIAMIKKPSKN
jgi:ElaA protein